MQKYLESRHDSLHVSKVIARVKKSQNKPNMSNTVYRQLRVTKCRSICKRDTKGLTACTTLPKSLIKPMGPNITNSNQITCLYEIRSNQTITQAETKGYPFEVQNL